MVDAAHGHVPLAQPVGVGAGRALRDPGIVGTGPARGGSLAALWGSARLYYNGELVCAPQRPLRPAPPRETMRR